MRSPFPPPSPLRLPTETVDWHKSTDPSFPFFFADSYGHQDDHTTQGWSNQIDRIYLNSLFEFNLGTKQVTNVTSFSTAAKTSNSSTVLTNPVSRADGSLT